MKRLSSLFVLVLVTAFIAVLCASALLAQGQPGIQEKLGKGDFPNSCSPAVQEKLLRGVAMLHSFHYSATQRAFEEVVKGGFLAGPPAIWQVEKLNLVPGLRMAKSYLPRVVSLYAFGVHKTDTALLAKINTSLAKLKADGTLTTILTKYGY